MHWDRSRPQGLGKRGIVRQGNFAAWLRMLRRALHISTTAMIGSHKTSSTADRSDAIVARSISLFSLPWLRQHRRPGGADHDDVQSHGGKAPMALQRSLHQNHGFLPHASRAGGAATGDLRWLPETKTMGRRAGRCHLHCAGRDRDDRSELALCSLWQASSSNGRSVRAQAGCARHHRRGNY